MIDFFPLPPWVADCFETAANYRILLSKIVTIAWKNIIIFKKPMNYGNTDYFK